MLEFTYLSCSQFLGTWLFRMNDPRYSFLISTLIFLPTYLTTRKAQFLFISFFFFLGGVEGVSSKLHDTSTN